MFPDYLSVSYDYGIILAIKSNIPWNIPWITKFEFYFEY